MTPEKLALKRATAEMIKGVGGLETAASFEHCRIAKSQLGNYQSAGRPDQFIPVDVVADLEPLARDREGWPHVTRALCQQMGGVFVPLPVAMPEGADLLAALGRQAKEHADVAQAICKALSDGQICRADVREVRTQLWDLIEQAVAMDAELALMETEGK